MGQFYDNPDRFSYYFSAAAVAAGGVLGRIAGPPGKVGRVRALRAITGTAFTVADSILDIDTITPSLATPVTLTIPFTGSATGDLNQVANATLDAASDLPADTVLELTSDGGSTAGDADIELVVEWY